MANHTLTITNLSKSYNSKNDVLSDINLTINASERLAICGSNGSGKTTLLRILTTLIPPTNGEIIIDGKKYSNLPPSFLNNIGWMPSDSLGMYARLTGLENIKYFQAFYRMMSSEIQRKIDEWNHIEIFKESLKTPFYLCSTGMKCSLLFFKAIMHSPTLLFLDEPLKSFDDKTRKDIIEFLKQYSQNKIVVFSSHQQDDVADVSTKIVSIKEGRIA